MSLDLEFNELFAQCDGDSFRTVPGADFCEQTFDMRADGCLANAELTGDVFVSESAGDGLKHLLLTGTIS